MKEKFLPIILGTDANAYGIARSFYDEYGVKSVAIGKIALRETQYSKIIDVITVSDIYNKDIFLKTLFDIKKNHPDVSKFILISCAEWYTDLILNNKKELEKDFILPFMTKDLKDKLEDKESFYNLCEKYNLDYPSTYIITYKNKDNINLPFDFPVALKPASSTDYSKVDFAGKEKSYKINSLEELKKTVNNIYSSNYRSNLIVQDFIPGNDDTMWVLNCYSNKDGKVKMMCLGQCILEEHTPYGVGNYKAIISTGNDEIYEKIKNFLEDIHYVGFSNFDLKYDYRDGKYKLFEINVRQGRSSYFSVAAGCNLAKYLVEDYILNLDKETVYNTNEHLWLAVPKSVLKKYAPNKEVLNKALKLIKEGKYSYTLKNHKDGNLKRRFWINVIYFKDYKRYKMYPPTIEVK